jgi:hypothetical protein
MATNLPKKNRPSEIDALQKLADGLTKHAAAIPQMVIGGVTTTPADAGTKLQARITVAKAVVTTRATWQNAVAADETATEQTKTFLSGLRQTLLAAFAGQIDVLADFGLTPRKVAVLTPAERAASALKAQATRAARNTLGKVQKAAITANVTITPATATPVKPASASASAPAPTPTPASASAPAPAPTPTPTPAPAPAVPPPAPAPHS